MAVFLLDEKIIAFPNPTLAEENGLLAVGGNLSQDRLVLAYRHGIFPWYSEGEPICWWCPKVRYIIRPENIHVSHSMKKFMKKHDIEFESNRDFAYTMHRCRMKRKSNTWITDDMERAYYKLHKAGYAMSFEAVIDGQIAGGLYGVVLNKCFFGESMYTDMENGSKLALIGLSRRLERMDYKMIDCQFHTDHLESMGGEYISYNDYLNLIEEGSQDGESGNHPTYI